VRVCDSIGVTAEVRTIPSALQPGQTRQQPNLRRHTRQGIGAQVTRGERRRTACVSMYCGINVADGG